MKLRFTIRDLLWLMALVAVCIAWWVDRRRATEYEQKAEFVVNNLMNGVMGRQTSVQEVYDHTPPDRKEQFTYHPDFGWQRVK
jgi:hypothetical protein